MSLSTTTGGPLYAIIDSLEAGVVILDCEQRILHWNRWLARRSNLSCDEVSGRYLTETLPEITDTRLIQAVGQAITDGLPSLLSPALHGLLLPLYQTADERNNEQRMHQLIHVIPLRDQADAACMIQISDVTANISRERLLRRQAEALRRITSHDTLTGLANRRTFDETLKREFAKARRLGRPIALLILDIDFFNQYNLDYGHELGDACLGKISGALQTCLRPLGDLAARYGGDEFALILPGMDEIATCRMAEMLRQSVNELAIPFLGSELAAQLTVSIGAAVMPPGDDADTHTLLSSADVALYQAKHEGRNRAVYFSVEDGSFRDCEQVIA